MTDTTQKTEQQELLPCPFCGGKATKLNRYTVGCQDCDAEINTVNVSHSPEEQWNRRVAPAAPSVPVSELEPYDAGLLSDHGGGNIEWWQDYIRAELGRAHDFYQSQVASVPAAPQQECCDTPNYCSSVRRCTAQDSAPAQAAPQQEPLNEAQLDHIARSYFAEKWAQDYVKHAISDAFKVAATHPQAAPRCNTCDGTGDLISFDGEWRGKCPCSSQAAQPKNCSEVPPGNGYCDQCAAGNYEQCRYVVPQEAGQAREVTSSWDAEKERIYNEGYQDGKEVAPHKFAASSAPSVSADAMDAERDKTIRQAVAYLNGKWPQKLSSGVMFFWGERITQQEFAAIAAQSKGASE